MFAMPTKKQTQIRLNRLNEDLAETYKELMHKENILLFDSGLSDWERLPIQADIDRLNNIIDNIRKQIALVSLSDGQTKVF
jgi:hypothetical protein